MTVSGKLLVSKGVELFVARCPVEAVIIVTTDLDKLVLNAVEKFGHKHEVIRPDQKYGRLMEKRQDRELLFQSDDVALFWDGASPRGEWLVKKAITYKVNLCVFNELGIPQKFVEWAL